MLKRAVVPVVLAGGLRDGAADEPVSSEPPIASATITATLSASTTVKRRALSGRSGARCAHCTSTGSVVTRPPSLVPRPA